jgi:hypothetical protein
VELTRQIVREADPLRDLAGGAVDKSVYRLDHALQILDDRQAHRLPLVVALLGGTGVGKSSLFNALLGGNHSPASNIRAFTREPYIACRSDDRSALASAFSNSTVNWIEHNLPKVAFVDTPDVDSVIRENRQVARSVVEAADVIVYVTSPLKYANFEIHQEIKSWAAKKRWFFVLNHADQAGDLQAVVAGFDARLRELGFTPDNHVRFAVSATHTNAFDLETLRSALLTERSKAIRLLLPRDSFLGEVRAATAEGHAAISECLDRLVASRQELDGMTRNAYLKALNGPNAAETLAVMIRERTWGELAGRVGWPATLAAWFRCRFSTLAATYGLGRLAVRAPGALSWLALGAAATAAMFQSLMPLRRLRSMLGPDFRREMDGIRNAVDREIEDQGLGQLCQIESNSTTPSAPPFPGRSIPYVGQLVGWIYDRLGGATADDGEEFFGIIDRIDNGAIADARKLDSALVRIIANIIPIGLLIHIAYRWCNAWWRAE